jgi:hypothetical protein
VRVGLQGRGVFRVTRRALILFRKPKPGPNQQNKRTHSRALDPTTPPAKPIFHTSAPTLIRACRCSKGAGSGGSGNRDGSCVRRLRPRLCDWIRSSSPPHQKPGIFPHTYWYSPNPAPQPPTHRLPCGLLCLPPKEKLSSRFSLPPRPSLSLAMWKTGISSFVNLDEGPHIYASNPAILLQIDLFKSHIIMSMNLVQCILTSP